MTTNQTTGYTANTQITDVYPDELSTDTLNRLEKELPYDLFNIVRDIKRYVDRQEDKAMDEAFTRGYDEGYTDADGNIKRRY